MMYSYAISSWPDVLVCLDEEADKNSASLGKGYKHIRSHQAYLLKACLLHCQFVIEKQVKGSSLPRSLPTLSVPPLAKWTFDDKPGYVSGFKLLGLWKFQRPRILAVGPK